MKNNPAPFLKGLGASTGLAQGKIKIINSADEWRAFNPGDILVTKITDPSMVMIMSQAAAIVTDLGGLTSHPAIVSRELGIPCVVAAKTATADLKDGMKVLVNGTTGEIFLAEDDPDERKAVEEVILDQSRENNDYKSLVEAYRRAYSTMDTNTFEHTVDFTKLDPLIAEGWMEKVLEIIAEVGRQKLTDCEVAELMHTPGTLRNNAIFDLFMASLAKLPTEKKKTIADFYINGLKAVCKKDLFSLAGHNVIHDEETIKNFLQTAKPASPEIAKKLGRLINASYHAGYSLYGDMNPQLVYENYGPYIARINDADHTVVIKEFKNFQPLEFWPELSKLPIKKITIVCLYQNVKFSVDAITHTRYEGDVINGLKFYALFINEQPAEAAEAEKASVLLEKYSEFVWFIFKKFDDGQYKKLYLYQKAYNYINLCKRLGLEWRPSGKIINEMLKKPLKSWPSFNNAEAKNEFFLKIIDPTTDFSGDETKINQDNF